MLDPRDEFLQKTHPVIAAPRFAPLEPLERNGERYVLAANGLFIQAQRTWLSCTRKVGAFEPGMRLGYGTLDDAIAISFPVPRDLLAQFIEAARGALPDELAGVLIWSEQTCSLRFALSESLSATPDLVAYRRPPLGPGETVAIDVHSHALGEAGFSPTDDKDDRSVNLALVYGDLDREVPSVALRMCLKGAFMPLDPGTDWLGIAATPL